jgi:uncharacterized protein YjiS (DUF1127 family)
MNTYVPQHYTAATLFRFGTLLQHAARVFKGAAQRLDQLIAIRKKAADDRRLLSEMNERELRDIGVSGAQSTAFRGGGSRERYERIHALEWRQPM